MSQDLISKKDLLDLTGISYGQLYRWKRKNLIPEEWFIRKSTFTGQETFFPKVKILERIEKIQLMKENLSLDELADVFSPELTNVSLSKEEILKRRISSKTVMDFFIENIGQLKEFSFEQTLTIYILEKMLQSGDINLEEGKMVLHVLQEHYRKVDSKTAELIFIRKLGMSTCFLASNSDELFFEKGTKVVVRLSLASCLEELKSKWT
ncbi:YhbD family protein [Heyndrickxia sporothermodurans]|uniref:YhbD family protein n=1 Tax=Heyndrickxia sporothermodurans TaxID=46224 RepID=UPI0035D9390B